MPFAAELGLVLVLVLVLVEASAERVVAQLDWAPRVAVPLHRGRTMVTAQTSVYDDRERLVAQTTQVQTVR
jgi:hypothetical protein